MRKQTYRDEQLALAHPNAAGLDIGAQEIWVRFPAARESEPVK